MKYDKEQYFDAKFDIYHTYTSYSVGENCNIKSLGVGHTRHSSCWLAQHQSLHVQTYIFLFFTQIPKALIVTHNDLVTIFCSK